MVFMFCKRVQTICDFVCDTDLNWGKVVQCQFKVMQEEDQRSWKEKNGKGSNKDMEKITLTLSSLI